MFSNRLGILWGVLLLGAAGGVSAGSEALQSHDSIRAKVRAHLEQRLSPEQRAGARIEVGRLDPRLRLPACGNPLQTFATGTRPTVGAVTVGVRCESHKPWTLYVSARVAVYGPVVVAAEPLPRGTPVTPQHVRVERRDLSTLSFGWLTAPEQALGRITKRPYRPGQVLQPNQLEEPKLVRRGEQVIVRASAGGLEISINGQALADGVRGERIRVRNLRSKRIIEGEVVDAGVVRVNI